MEDNSHGVARKIVMFTLIIVMLGYFILWIIMPTNLYRMNWRPKLIASLKSTYFGNKEGPGILLFTFPMIFISVLGSVYLHLGNRYRDHGIIRKEQKKKNYVTKWKRPIIVKGPLGIVSGVELSFLAMFISLLIWSLYTFLHLGYGRIIVRDGEKRWLAKWETTVFRLGLAGNICLALLFYPVTRSSTILKMLGLTSEGCIKYHIWLGHIVMAFFSAHGLGYLLLWAVTGELSAALKWDNVGVSNIAGEVSLLGGLILWATTFPKIRRQFFELFFYTHYLYIIFMLFFFLHVGISYGFYSLPGFFLFVIDRYLRFLQSREHVRLVSARVLDSGALELNFAKSPRLMYSPTSIIFINVPGLSRMQWHPFTVTSSSMLDSEEISVVIKVEGSWTRSVYDVVSTTTIDRLEVSVEGPYGPSSNHFLRYDTLVMISGGSGVTPYFSIIRELLYTSSTLKHPTPKLLLISSFKNTKDLSMLHLILPHSASTPYDLSKLDLQIKAYVTRESQQSTQDLFKQPQTIWFKPLISDVPMSPILGKNGYLWLGAIISSSFVGFLIFMGLLTRYYIYPFERNTDQVFSTSLKTVLCLLILCVCVVVTSSFGVMWNKKLNAKQIANKNGASLQGTPESQYHNADREVESLPHRSLVESVEVHYGGRPDLKRLLLDMKEPSVGVLASGPPALRHDIASICRSGMAENLHFESISFNW